MTETMTTVADVGAFMEALAPKSLAADWDNVGLLIGDGARPAARIMTCLSLTRDVVEEAVTERADLVVVHHPLPFRPLKAVTTGSFDGGRVWRLASAGISVYSPHTGFDSAARGINQRLAELLNLSDIAPLTAIAAANDPQIGVGRRGVLRAGLTLDAFAKHAKAVLRATDVAVVGPADRQVRSVAICCGSGGDLLRQAVAVGADCFLTGEANFHTALEAEAAGIALVLVGHYASERFALEILADDLQQAFPKTKVWAACDEADPLRRVV
ncbi:MAG: Nif3-like dinuclear metal center hexameric protein [Pirellula sp.]|nr:Nif3-like dinuclear metal center hexameric protein [Pirellula sp.]